MGVGLCCQKTQVTERGPLLCTKQTAVGTWEEAGCRCTATGQGHSPAGPWPSPPGFFIWGSVSNCSGRLGSCIQTAGEGAQLRGGISFMQPAHREVSRKSPPTQEPFTTPAWDKGEGTQLHQGLFSECASTRRLWAQTQLIQ